MTLPVPLPPPSRFVDPDEVKGILVLRDLRRRCPDASLPRLYALSYLATRDHLRRYGRLIWLDNYLPLSTGPCPSVFAFYLRALGPPPTERTWNLPEYEQFLASLPPHLPLPVPDPLDYGRFSISDRTVLQDTLRATDTVPDDELCARTRDTAWQAGINSGLIGLDHLLLEIPDTERESLAAYLFDHTPTWTL